MVLFVSMEAVIMMEYLRYITVVDGALCVTTYGAHKKVLLLVDSWDLSIMSHTDIVTASPQNFGLMTWDVLEMNHHYSIVAMMGGALTIVDH